MPAPPVAKFSASVLRAYAPMAVRFTNTSTGQVNAWAWDFGDGQTSAEKSPLHVFAAAGTYAVTLKATGLNGESTSTVTTITALPPAAPVANFAPSALRGYAPLSVRFTNATSGQVNTWAWDFGDGASSDEKSPLHVFTEPGIYTVKLTATGLTDPASSKTVTINVLRPGLVAGWGFEEAGGASALDVTGRGQTGVISAATREAAGKYGKALSFNGYNSWVTVGHNAAQVLSRGMTLEAWVRPASLSGWRSVLMKEQPGGPVYELYANTSDLFAAAGGVYTDAESFVVSPTQLTIGIWTHLATTYDGEAMRLYVNGVEVASFAQSGPIKASASALRIGGNNVWGEFFDGLIDEVRVYNRALSAAEIQKDMTLPVAPPLQ